MTTSPDVPHLVAAPNGTYQVEGIPVGQAQADEWAERALYEQAEDLNNALDEAGLPGLEDAFIRHATKAGGRMLACRLIAPTESLDGVRGALKAAGYAREETAPDSKGQTDEVWTLGGVRVRLILATPGKDALEAAVPVPGAGPRVERGDNGVFRVVGTPRSAREAEQLAHGALYAQGEELEFWLYEAGAPMLANARTFQDTHPDSPDVGVVFQEVCTIKADAGQVGVVRRALRNAGYMPSIRVPQGVDRGAEVWRLGLVWVVVEPQGEPT